MRRRHRRGRSLLSNEDVDPLAMVANLFDAILVLTVAVLVTWSAARAKAKSTPEDGVMLEGFVDSGVKKAGQGERLGVAYRLADGKLIYVPE